MSYIKGQLPSNSVFGTGTPPRIPKWSAEHVLVDSSITDNITYINIDGYVVCGGSASGQSVIQKGLTVNESGSSDGIFRVETSVDEEAFVVNALTNISKFKSDFSLKNGATVNDIETILTDDATHIATSSAIWAEIDESRYREITLSNLMLAIAGSTLVAGNWYLITDFRTILPILSANPVVFFTGNVEQIFVKALSANTLQRQGVSKTYPDELIEFDPTIINYFNSGWAEYYSGGSGGDWTTTINSSTTFTLSGGSILPAATEWSSFYIFCEDYDDGGDFEYELSDLGTGWDFDEATQQFTLYNLVDVDLNNDIYMEYEVDWANATVTNGSIKARNNVAKNLYFQGDYRGEKVRRHKTNAPAWVAGSYNLGDTVVHSSYVYGALKPTTETPSVNSRAWVQLFYNDYLMPPTNYSINGVYCQYDSSNYVDSYIFDLASFDTSTSKLNLKIVNTVGRVNIYFDADINSSFNATIIASQANTIDGAVYNSNVVLSNCLVKNIYNSKITQGSNFISTTLNSCNFGYISGAIFYNLSRTDIIQGTNNIFRAYSENNIFFYITSTLFGDRCSNNLMFYCTNNDFYNHCDFANVAKMYNNTFNSNFAYNLITGAFYNNIFNSNCYRNKFFGSTAYNTFYYVADNIFNKGGNYNTLPTNFNLSGNVINGSFSNNTPTNVGTSWISNNVFNDVAYNTGAGRLKVQHNSGNNSFSNNSFVANLTTIQYNSLGLFGGASASYTNYFSASGDTTIEHNDFSGCTFQKNNIKRGTHTYNVGTGSFINNTVGNTASCDLTKNTFQTGFENNTIDIDLEGNMFPAGFDSKTLNSSFHFDNLTLQKGLGSEIKTMTSDDRIENTDNVVYLDTSSNDVNGELQLALGTGRVYRIISNSSNNLATITPNGTDKLDGVAGSYKVENNSSVLIQDYSTGNWEIISKGAYVTGSGSSNKIAYWSSATGLTSDTALHWDNVNNRLGINTSTPTASLHILSTTTALNLNRIDDTAYGGAVKLDKARGSAGSETVVATDDAIGIFNFRGYGGSLYKAGAKFGAKISSGTKSDTSMPAYLYFSTTPSGSVTPLERLRIASDGNIGINTNSPKKKLDVNDDGIIIRTAKTPASATATGVVGEISWDSNYVYVCVATNTWKRTALSTW
jgi:hypothetical protein